MNEKRLRLKALPTYILIGTTTKSRRNRIHKSPGTMARTMEHYNSISRRDENAEHTKQSISEKKKK